MCSLHFITFLTKEKCKKRVLLLCFAWDLCQNSVSKELTVPWSDRNKSWGHYFISLCVSVQMHLEMVMWMWKNNICGDMKMKREEKRGKEKGRKLLRAQPLGQLPASDSDQSLCPRQSLYSMIWIFFNSRAQFSWTLFFFSYQKGCFGESLLTVTLQLLQCGWQSLWEGGILKKN